MTLILRSLPDLSDGSARRQFADRARSENALVFGTASDWASVAGDGPLCVRAALNGREEVFLGRDRLVVDDDVFLILNPGTVHASRIRARDEVFSFSVHFADAVVREVLGWRRATAAQILEHDGPSASALPRIGENLRPHERCVSPVLRYLMLVCRDGAGDVLWVDEQLRFLLERVIACHRHEEERVRSLRAVRARTRREIYRRIARATDFILSNYDASLDLCSMAEVACLEKHHFLKLFSMVHGLTPFEFLRRKRLIVALRLLRNSTQPHGEIARIAGLGTRHTLLRALKEFTGSSPQAYKREASAEASGWQGELARLLAARRDADAGGTRGAWLVRPDGPRMDLAAQAF